MLSSDTPLIIKNEIIKSTTSDNMAVFRPKFKVLTIKPHNIGPTIVGPILWGFIVNTLNLGRNTAMLSLVVLLMISFFIIRGVSDESNFVN